MPRDTIPTLALFPSPPAAIDLLLKPYDSLTSEEKEKLVHFFCDLEFFQRYIYHHQDRQEFVKAACKYFEYCYYPQGAAIYDYGDTVDFGVIISGKAVAYLTGREKEIINEKPLQDDYGRLNTYAGHEDHSSSPERQSWVSLRTSKVGGASPSLKNLRYSRTDEYPSQKRESFVKISDMILKTERNAIYQSKESRSSNQYFEMGGSKEGTQDRNRNQIMAVLRELKQGDAICEIVLGVEKHADHSLAATEDVHMVRISKENLKLLFRTKLAYLKEKKEFLSGMFPELHQLDATRLCACIEERMCYNKEKLYNYGDEADALYIIKTGQFQLYIYDEEEKDDEEREKSLHPLDRSKSPKKKLYRNSSSKIRILEKGHLFGEGEIFNSSKRNHLAMCTAPETLLYVIKKEAYHKIIKTYFEDIDVALSSWYVKDNVPTETETKKEGLSLSPLKRIFLKTTRLMNRVEAKYRKATDMRPKLIVETKAAQVISHKGRGSRLIGNKVEITVCGENNQTYFTQQQNEDISAVQYNSKEEKPESLKRTKLYREIDGKIRSVKSSLFLQNQANLDNQKLYRSYYNNINHLNNADKLSSSTTGQYPENNLGSESYTRYTSETPFQGRSESPVKICNQNRELETPSRRSIDSRKARSIMLNLIQTQRIRHSSKRDPNKMRTSSPSAPVSYPSVTQIISEEPAKQKVLSVGSAYMLKRVMSTMKKRELPVQPMGTEVPMIKIPSFNYVTNTEDDSNFSKSTRTKTSAMVNTITSLENLDNGSSIRPLTLVSLCNVEQKAANENNNCLRDLSSDGKRGKSLTFLVPRRDKTSLIKLQRQNNQRLE